MKSIFAATLALAPFTLAVPATAATNITGAGSSFVAPVMARWSADYNKQTGDQINYQPNGSGAGIAGIKAGTIDFGASDKPLGSAELAAAGLAQFPVVVGGILPVINVAGVAPGKLHFTGALLADVMMGRVKMWNDAAIAKINPGVRLPAAAITVVHRADASGTTYNLTHFLGQVNPAWKAGPGEGTTVTWPAGSVGGKGNAGVAQGVKGTANSIGYVEYAYVVENKLTYALVANAAGRYVAPGEASFAAAAARAPWERASDFNLVMTNAPGPNAWPLTASTFVLVYKQPKADKAASAAAAIKFFHWTLSKGQADATALNYVPLPATLVTRINAYLAANVK